MTRSPVIGITLRVLHEKGLSADLARNRAYFDALAGAGGAPLGISASLSESRLRELFDLCDGLCLPGGPDVDPALYGEETRADCAVDVDEELDRAEMLLARWALDADKPVLAICRGAQVLNVALGGTLWQDVGTQGATEHNHSQDGSRQELTHNIDIAPDTRLRAIAGAQIVDVNSMHHQALRNLGRDLVVTARAHDGLVEAVEHPGRRFVVALQCHPEELYLERDWARRLFAGFVASAAGVAPAANVGGPTR
ncbi:MAG: gamma-glutamyl-gamma-aminobutyrate hydrolase family protein [Candidatus Dormiibacterota bacterium]